MIHEPSAVIASKFRRHWAHCRDVSVTFCGCFWSVPETFLTRSVDDSQTFWAHSFCRSFKHVLQTLWSRSKHVPCTLYTDVSRAYNRHFEDGSSTFCRHFEHVLQMFRAGVADVSSRFCRRSEPVSPTSEQVSQMCRTCFTGILQTFRTFSWSFEHFPQMSRPCYVEV